MKIKYLEIDLNLTLDTINTWYKLTLDTIKLTLDTIKLTLDTIKLTLDFTLN